MKNRNNVFFAIVYILVAFSVFVCEHYEVRGSVWDAVDVSLYHIMNIVFMVAGIFVFIAGIYALGYLVGVRSAKFPLIGLGVIIPIANICLFWHHTGKVIFCTTLLSLVVYFLLTTKAEEMFYKYFTAPTPQELADAQEPYE